MSTFVRIFQLWDLIAGSDDEADFAQAFDELIGLLRQGSIEEISRLVDRFASQTADMSMPDLLDSISPLRRNVQRGN